MTIKTVKTQENSYLVNGTMSVPNDPANSDYQAILDWINEGNTPKGPDVIEPDYVALRTGPEGYAPVHEQLAMQTDGTWEAHITDVKTRFPKTNKGSTTIGDVPQDLLDAAAAKLSAQQLNDYTTAISRLAQYQVALGREEVVESKPTPEQVWDKDAEKMVDVMHDVITTTAIEPVEARVEVTTYDEEGKSTTAMAENPLITQDKAERAEAQAIVDATPQSVIDTYNGE
jgi:hypothetical protein